MAVDLERWLDSYHKKPSASRYDAAREFFPLIEWADETGSLLTLSNAGRWTVYVDWANGGYEDGTSTYPWNTVWEGYGAVYEYGTVNIAPGSYPGALTLRKNATLTRWGSSGMVTIGQ